MHDILVIDTNVLIDQQRGLESAGLFITDVVRRNIAAIHPVMASELITGARTPKSLRAAKALLASFRLLAVRNSDLVSSLELLERHRLSAGVDWPDCLIAATCMRLKMPLVTLNSRHFSIMQGLQIIRPY